MSETLDIRNLQLDPELLPRTESVGFLPLERDHLKASLIQWMLILIAIIILAVLFFLLLPEYRTKDNMIITGSVWLTAAICTIANILIGFRYKSYALREKDILFRRGWMNRNLHIIPISRIQHAVVHSGPLDRRYDLATLSLHTAASGIPDISIPGLRSDTAEKMRAYIIDMIKDTRTDAGME
jgi:hypothetical protein